jgi:hypothetical protein
LLAKANYSSFLLGGGGAICGAISTTCTTLSHIRNLRSKVIFFLDELMDCVNTGRAKRSNGTCDLHDEPGGLHPPLKSRSFNG